MKVALKHDLLSSSQIKFFAIFLFVLGLILFTDLKDSSSIVVILMYSILNLQLNVNQMSKDVLGYMFAIGIRPVDVVNAKYLKDIVLLIVLIATAGIRYAMGGTDVNNLYVILSVLPFMHFIFSVYGMISIKYGYATATIGLMILCYGPMLIIKFFGIKLSMPSIESISIKTLVIIGVAVYVLLEIMVYILSIKIYAKEEY